MPIPRSEELADRKRIDRENLKTLIAGLACIAVVLAATVFGLVQAILLIVGT